MRLHKGDNFRDWKGMEGSSSATWYKMKYIVRKRESIRYVEMEYMKYVAVT